MKNLIPVSKVVSSLTRKCPVSSSSLCCNFSPAVLVSSRTHLGYIPAQGRQGRVISNKEKFLLELRRVNIQPVKKATFTFDPIREDYHSIRNFMFFFNKPKVIETNIKVAIKTEIVDDRRDPLIKLELNDGRDLEIKTANLTELEILRVMNFYTLPLVSEEKVTETKSGKGPDKRTAKKGKK